MEDELIINEEPEVETQEVETAPVAEDPPAWDFPTYTPPAPEEPEEDVFADVHKKASDAAIRNVSGLLKNQSDLRAAMAKHGASPETVMLAEATLLSMDPNMMGQPGAAQIAASLAIGQMTMSGKSWKTPPVASPPPANPIGRENPTQNTAEFDAELEAATKAFSDLGLTEEQIREVIGA